VRECSEDITVEWGLGILGLHAFSALFLISCRRHGAKKCGIDFVSAFGFTLEYEVFSGMVE